MFTAETLNQQKAVKASYALKVFSGCNQGIPSLLQQIAFSVYAGENKLILVIIKYFIYKMYSTA